MQDKRNGFFQGNRSGRIDGGGGGYGGKNNPPNFNRAEKIKFRDEQNHLRRELLVTEAEIWAKSLGVSVSLTQLRKFYNEALSLKSKIKEKEFEEMKALVGMMISKAHYSKVRDKKNEELYRFIYSCIDSVKSAQDFEDFVLFFEAVLGFFPRKK